MMPKPAAAIASPPRRETAASDSPSPRGAAKPSHDVGSAQQATPPTAEKLQSPVKGSPGSGTRKGPP
eukprot:3088638-Pyramimonas_sp.AAC.1